MPKIKPEVIGEALIIESGSNGHPMTLPWVKHPDEPDPRARSRMKTLRDIKRKLRKKI